MRINDFLIVLIFLFGTSATCSRKTQANPEGFQPLTTKMNLGGFSTDCKSFIKSEIRQNWLLHTSQDCYYENRSFWESVITQKACFIGKSKEQIRSIFGKPSNTFKLKQSWDIYYLGKRCEKNVPYFSLQFHYNEDEMLSNIANGQVTYD